MAALGSLAAACGATPTPEVIEKEVTTVVEKEVTKLVEVPAMTEPITLRVMSLGGVRGMKAHQFGGMYGQLRRNVTVKLEDTSFGEMQLKTELLYGTGNLQDVLYGHNSYTAIGAHKGWYLQLDDLLAATDAVPDYDDFFKPLVENIMWEGGTYAILDWAIPGSTTFVYNRKHFEDAGVPIPSREVGALDVWEVQELVLSVANSDKGIFGLTIDHGRTFGNAQWSRCWGRPDYGPNGDTRGWIISADGKTFNFANNEFQKTWYNDWYLPLLEAKAIPKAEDQVEGGLFYGGLQAIQQWQVMSPRRTWLRVQGQWDYSLDDYFLMPHGPDGRIGTASQSQNWQVGGLTKYPEESLRLIGFYTSREAGLFEIFEAESGYTSRASVYTDPKVVEYSPNYQPTHDLLMTGNVEPSPTPWNLRWAEVADAFSNLYEPLREGRLSWDEQAPVIQEEIDKILEQPIL